MLELLGIFLSTWAFGSVGGTAYAVAHGFSNLQTILIIALNNTLLVVLWFGIIGFGTKKIRNFLERYRKKGIKIPFLLHREKAGSLTTVGLGLMSAFTLGSMWAVIGAYAINAKKWQAWAAITSGDVTAGFIWTLVSLGIIHCLPSPWWLYCVAVGLTIAFVGRKMYQNFEQIKEVWRQIRGTRVESGLTHKNVKR